GLVIGFGDTGSVGIGGITLGGGVGYLVRAFGLSIDNVLAVELVTADSEVRLADAVRDPDLFWALRGGGGNFGVATRFRYRLHELPEVVGGMLILPATAESVAGFIAAAEAAPESVSTIANVMPAPPMPFLDPGVIGWPVIFALIVCAAGASEGEAALAPFRALAEPYADLLRPMTYAEMFPPEDEEYHPTAISRTLFMDTFDVDIAARILDAIEASDASLRVAQIRVLGGAMARIGEAATAFAHRARRIMVNVAAFYEGEADRPDREAWVVGLASMLSHGDSAAYVNFLSDEGPLRVRDAYPPATWDRLQRIKARVDPENLFRRNQNVPPVPAMAGEPGRDA
ncbi:MAG: BBE domain-containing protein, partial [Candidatus Limnocylindrales bacterium]